MTLNRYDAFRPALVELAILARRGYGPAATATMNRVTFNILRARWGRLRHPDDPPDNVRGVNEVCAAAGLPKIVIIDTGSSKTGAFAPTVPERTILVTHPTLPRVTLTIEYDPPDDDGGA